MVLLLSALILHVIFGSIYWYWTIPRNLPPGPVGLPLFGSMFSTWRVSGVHTKLHGWTQIYGQLYSFYIAEKLVVVLGSSEMMQEALVKQGDIFSSKPKKLSIQPDEFAQEGAGLVNSNGDVWKTQRRFALSTFRDFGLGRSILEPLIKEEADHLVRAIDANMGKPFDPSFPFCFAAGNMISRMLFGRRFLYEDERFVKVVALVERIMHQSNVSPLAPYLLSVHVAKVVARLPMVNKLKAISNSIVAFTSSQIPDALRGFDPHNGTPSNYVQAFSKANAKSEEDSTAICKDIRLVAACNNFFVAGTDTTGTTLGWAIFYLSHYPQWQRKVYEEIREHGKTPYVDRSKLPVFEAVLMETQRLANLAPLGNMHTTTQDTVLCGYHIPEDTIIVPLMTAALMDPVVYHNPKVFDPNRFLKARMNGEKDPVLTNFVPFSIGKRACLGESMAKMELFVFLLELISNFEFSFPPDHPKPLIDGESVSLIRAPPHYEICAVRRQV